MRLGGVCVTMFFGLNPYAHADADAFAASANRIAEVFLNGSIPALQLGDIYQLWGLLLSPFWIIPGPSRIYARVGVAILGATAVYNVYIIARRYHSHLAGVTAILPLLFYPSFIFIHATILREAAVLFGLTTAARLLFAPSRRLSPPAIYGGVAVAVVLATIVRTDNIPIYILAFLVAFLLSTKPWQEYPRSSGVVASIGVLTFPVVILDFGSSVVKRLADLRSSRARGRTEYLGWVFPDTIPEALGFSWIGASYFLFTPFPWMVAQVSDFVVMFQGLGNLAYTVAAISGARTLARKAPAGTGGLVAGIAVGVIVYGLGTANVGTAVRHRQMVLWAIFLLGGIGIASHFPGSVSGER